jgi:hypothetical protein
VAALMERVREEARRLEAELPPRPPRRAAGVPPRLEENWDPWRPAEVTSHRGWAGLPVVLLKRALLRALGPHDRELLRRQRAFNQAALEELVQLRELVAELREEVAALRRKGAGRDGGGEGGGGA